MPPLSPQSWLSVVLSWASSVLGTRKSHRGPGLGNTVAAASLVCRFWPKICAQATMCEQGRYHGAKANFCSSTNPGVLADCFAQIAHNLQVIFLIDRSTLWQQLMMHRAPEIEENCKQNLHIRPNLARFFRSLRARVASERVQGSFTIYHSQHSKCVRALNSVFHTKFDTDYLIHFLE